MASTAPLARDHHIILRALEVLRLMSDRLAADHRVDGPDLEFLLGFFRNVAQHCLENTEKSLLRPALARAAPGPDASRLDIALTNHDQVQTLFVEMNEAYASGNYPEFVFFARMYACFFADLIFEEGRLLPPLVRSLLAGPEDRARLAEFEKTESEIGRRARQHGAALHRLESRYLAPHCI
jgi:hemerythrin-like domain-containing protein